MKGKSTLIVKFVLFSLVFFSVQGFAQDVNFLDPTSSLYSDIKRQEVNFKVKETADTILLGTVSFQSGIYYHPHFAYNAEPYITKYYTDPATFYYLTLPGAQTLPAPTHSTTMGTHLGDNANVDPPLKESYTGVEVTVYNVRHIYFRINIPSWEGKTTDAASLDIILGKTSTHVNKGQSSVVIPVTNDTVQNFEIHFHGLIPSKTNASEDDAWGLLPLKLHWSLIGVGAITIPVLPISIVYAPVVDRQKKNTSYVSTTYKTGNITTMSFSTENSKTSPVNTTFHSFNEMQKGLVSVAGNVKKDAENIKEALSGTNAMGNKGSDDTQNSNDKKDVPPSTISEISSITTSISDALNQVSLLIGSSQITESNTLTTTSQHTLSVDTTSIVKMTTDASQGGPGVGDLIAYYYNVKAIWYYENGNMRLSILGGDNRNTNQMSVSQLKQARDRLYHSAKGTIDATVNLDSGSITSLLKLDPYVHGGSDLELDTPRFLDVSLSPVKVGAGGYSKSLSVIKSNNNVQSKIETDISTESDQAGLLSIIGIGQTTTQTIKASIMQTSTRSNNNSETQEQAFMLNGNGSTENYSTHIYYDAVFNAYAFSDITSHLPCVQGVIKSKSSHLDESKEIILIDKFKMYTTKPKKDGTFVFNIHDLAKGPIVIKYDGQKIPYPYSGDPIPPIEIDVN